MPAPCTGHVWDDRDGDGLLGPGDVPLAGLRVRINEAVFLNGYDQSAITDASVAVLRGFSGLTSVNLKRTKLTPGKIAELSGALPACRIEHDGGVIEAKK